MTDTFDDRLSAFEASLAGLVANQNSQSEALGKLERSIGVLSEKLGNVGRPQYSLMISAVGLVVLIGGIFGSGYIRDQTRIETEVVASRGKAVLDSYAQGRLDAVVERNKVGVDNIQTQIDSAKSEIQSSMAVQRGERMSQLTSLKEEMLREVALLDERLQREVAQINATTNERLTGLDTKLQLEIAIGSEQTKQLRVDTDRVTQMMAVQLPLSVEARGRLDERIRSLENAKP